MIVILICISGCDRTGKSTICNKLSELLNCKSVHFSAPKTLEEGKKQYFDFLDTVEPFKNVICDRFHDGEHIYAPIYRNYESNYLQEFEQKLKKHPYLFVNTKSSLQTIIERIEKVGEDFVKPEHYELVLNSFDRFLEKQSMPYIMINTDNNNLDEYIIDILVAMDKAQKLHDYYIKNNCTNLYYGNINAKNFIIANENNPSKIKRLLIEKEIYQDCWITTTENKDFVAYQLQLLKYENIYTIDGGI